MSRGDIGLILRLLGPVLEIVCLLLLFRIRGRDWHILGLPVEYLCYGGLALGLVMVAVGLSLSVPRSPRFGRESDEPSPPRR